MTVIPFSAFGNGAFRRVPQSCSQVSGRAHATHGACHHSSGSIARPNGKTVFGTVGLDPSTYVKTDRGWTAVEEIKVGTLVETFDDGWQPVQAIARHRVESALTGGSFPSRLVRIDPNVIGNTVDLFLPATQAVLLESDVSEDLFGDPFPLVMAQELVGAGIAKEAHICGNSEFFELLFFHPQLIFCAGGAVVVTRALDEQPCGLGTMEQAPTRYRVLDAMTAAALLRAERLAFENKFIGWN